VTVFSNNQKVCISVHSIKDHPIFIYNQYPKYNPFYSRILIAERTK